jgi:hypothetical protein
MLWAVTWYAYSSEKIGIADLSGPQQYCVNQSNAIKILQSLRDTKEDLATKLQQLRDTEPSVRSLDLSSYLLIPSR